MRRAFSLAFAACLVASSLPGCLLTPIHSERRQVTKWDLELIRIGSIRDVPVTIFGCIGLPVCWVVDAVIVNPIDSYHGAVVATHKHDWNDDAEGQSQSYAKSYQRSFGSVLLLPLDFTWRANVPVGPSDPAEWKAYWNEHVEVTSVASGE